MHCFLSFNNVKIVSSADCKSRMICIRFLSTLLAYFWYRLFLSFSSFDSADRLGSILKRFTASWYFVCSRTCANWNVLIRTCANWNVLSRTCANWNVLSRTCANWNVLICTCANWHVLSRTCANWNVLSRTCANWNVLSRTCANWNVLSRTCANWNVLIRHSLLVSRSLAFEANSQFLDASSLVWGVLFSSLTFTAYICSDEMVSFWDHSLCIVPFVQQCEDCVICRLQVTHHLFSFPLNFAGILVGLHPTWSNSQLVELLKQQSIWFSSLTDMHVVTSVITMSCSRLAGNRLLLYRYRLTHAM